MAFGKRAVGFGEWLWLANGPSALQGHCLPPQDVLQGKWGKVGALCPSAGMQEG